MRITLDGLGKQFHRKWIFKDLQYEFNSSQAYAILGPNGSGKTTLLQLINLSLQPTAGQVLYENSTGRIPEERVYRQLSFSASYLELVEELTLTECLDFHSRFKSFAGGRNLEDVISELGMSDYRHSQVGELSSGMKQRIKVALALLSDTNVVLLDEPATNLDADSIGWYSGLVKANRGDRILIIASNREVEYEFCTEQLKLPLA